MKKSTPAPNPDAYVAALDGWRRACVEALRAAVLDAAPLDEVIIGLVRHLSPAEGA